MGKKRTNGDGSMRKRPDGRWECRVTIGILPDGKPKFKYLYGKTQKEVKEKLTEFQRDIDDGIIDLGVCFDEWAQAWYVGYKDSVAASTYEGYRYTLRILIEYFGSTKLKEIKALHVETFLKKMKAEGKSQSSITKFRGMLFQIMNKAEANDMIRKNPVRFAEKMRFKESGKVKEAYTREEIKHLMLNLPVDRIGLSIRVMLGTGMRSQELLALEPKHIELDGSVIHVRQAVKLVKGKVVVGTTKSRDSIRDIPVPKEIKPYVLALRTYGEHSDREDGFIWEGKTEGQPANPSWFRKSYRKAISQVPDVRELTPHSCRHTYVTQLQSIGVAMETIQRLAGHASINMTDHYLHLHDDVKREAADKLGELFRFS